MSIQPISLTIPNRKPFVRCPTFIDGKGPPPHDFFDETQDHLGAFSQALLGTEWSCQTEDFENEEYPAGFLGQFTIQASLGLSLSPLDATQQGESGVWLGQAGLAPFAFAMRSHSCDIGTEDFLFSAKVKTLNRSRLAPLQRFGFHVSMGGLWTPHLPGFGGGGDTPNWHIFSPLSEGEPPVFTDTGVPFLEQTWYVLQWGRFQGGLWFLINGKPIFVQGRPGIYLPSPMSGVYRHFQTRRTLAALGLGDAFFIDYFHAFIKRATFSP